MNIGHPREKTAHCLYRQVTFFGGYIVLFKHRRLTELRPLFTEWSLFRGDFQYKFYCIVNYIFGAAPFTDLIVIFFFLFIFNNFRRIVQSYLIQGEQLVILGTRYKVLLNRSLVLKSCPKDLFYLSIYNGIMISHWSCWKKSWFLKIRKPRSYCQTMECSCRNLLYIYYPYLTWLYNIKFYTVLYQKQQKTTDHYKPVS